MTSTPFYIDGLTASAYHAAPGIGSSMIREVPDNPLTFLHRHMCRRPDCMKLLEDCQCPEGPLCDPHKVTPQMQLGTDVHRVLLDHAPIEVIPSTLLTPKGMRPTGKNELPLLEWEAEHRDSLHVLTEDSPVHRMVDSVGKYFHYFDAKTRYLRDCLRERSIWWIDEPTGLLCKARIDIWYEEHELLDLKTTKAPRRGPRDFQAEIAYYELHRQLAWYAEGGLAVDMVARESGFISIGNSPQYECWPHPMSPEALDLGYGQNVKARAELVERLASGNWYPKGYGEAVETGPPQWYMDKHGA